MNKHIALLALSLGACSGDPRLERCEKDLRSANAKLEDHAIKHRAGHHFDEVGARECTYLQELVAKKTDIQRGKIHTILGGCERVIDDQRRKDEEEAREVREAQRKAYCNGEDVPRPE